MPDKSTHFGNSLRHIRKSENLTIQSFAEKLGISKSFISEVERGEKDPGYKLIKSLKRTYPSLNLNRLIGEESAPPDTQRLEILEKRVNHLFDIVQENVECYENTDVVDLPFVPYKPGKKKETEQIRLPLALVKNKKSFAFRCKEGFPPEADEGDIVLVAPELEPKEQSIALVYNGSHYILARTSVENRKILLKDSNGRAITQKKENKIFGVVYFIMKSVY